MTGSGGRRKISLVASAATPGYIGLGKGSAAAFFGAKQKATSTAIMKLRPILRGCGAWRCECASTHSIPFKVTGKSGSVRVNLIPAPKGTGLAIGEIGKRILKSAGISDIYSKTFGHTKTSKNYAQAVYNALGNLTKKSLSPGQSNINNKGSLNNTK